MQLVDHLFGRDADGADEERGLLFDDDVKQIGKLALGVVVLDRRKACECAEHEVATVDEGFLVELQGLKGVRTLVFRALPPT